MNTSKDNFEFEIKKQINSREIAPSRDLWAAIESQTQNPEVIQTKKINWFLVAACMLLLVSLGTVLILDEDATPQVQIAQKETSFRIPVKNIPEQTSSETVIKPKGEQFTEIKNQQSQLAEIKTSAVVKAEKDLPIIKENPQEIAPQPVQIEQQILAKADSSKARTRRRFVDPSTLLFSVEHKDAIQKTKGGSNVATIDLHGK